MQTNVGQITARRRMGVDELEHVVVDANGMLTDRGRLIDGVALRPPLCGRSWPCASSRPTRTAPRSRSPPTPARSSPASSKGDEKRAYLQRLGATRTVADGNGANDVPILGAAALGIAVAGPEGASSAALAAADLMAPSILVALDLLCDPRALTATLRL